MLVNNQFWKAFSSYFVLDFRPFIFLACHTFGQTPSNKELRIFLHEHVATWPNPSPTKYKIWTVHHFWFRRHTLLIIPRNLIKNCVCFFREGWFPGKWWLRQCHLKVLCAMRKINENIGVFKIRKLADIYLLPSWKYL